MEASGIRGPNNGSNLLVRPEMVPRDNVTGNRVKKVRPALGIADEEHNQTGNAKGYGRYQIYWAVAHVSICIKVVSQKSGMEGLLGKEWRLMHKQ